MVTDQALEDERTKTRKLLPFWMSELLAIEDEAKRLHKAREPYGKGS